VVVLELLAGDRLLPRREQIPHRLARGPATGVHRQLCLAVGCWAQVIRHPHRLDQLPGLRVVGVRIRGVRIAVDREIALPRAADRPLVAELAGVGHLVGPGIGPAVFVHVLPAFPQAQTHHLPPAFIVQRQVVVPGVIVGVARRRVRIDVLVLDGHVRHVAGVVIRIAHGPQQVGVRVVRLAVEQLVV
jgi:hypothetical protein